jgi:hypothetical protein
MKKIKILRVRIANEIDCDLDTSYLGEYSASPKVSWAIDRMARGDCRHNQYRYFNPANSAEQTGCPDSPEQDYQRMEAMNRGDWHYIGIIAKAVLEMPSGILQTVRSSGVWGVESDCGEDAMREFSDEELDSLAGELLALGIGKRAIVRAFQKMED